MLPLGVSAVTVGFGFLIALDEPPLDLRGSSWLVPLAQALVGVPFVVRTMLPVLRVDRRAAAGGGGRARRVARRGSGGRSTCRSCGGRCWSRPGSRSPSRSASSARPCSSPGPTSPTLPVAVSRLLGQPGALNYGAAMAASVDPDGC